MQRSIWGARIVRIRCPSCRGCSNTAGAKIPDHVIKGLLGTVIFDTWGKVLPALSLCRFPLGTFLNRPHLRIWSWFRSTSSVNVNIMCCCAFDAFDSMFKRWSAFRHSPASLTLQPLLPPVDIPFHSIRLFVISVSIYAPSSFGMLDRRGQSPSPRTSTS